MRIGGGITGVQAVIQINSGGSGGLSETRYLLGNIDVKGLTAFHAVLRIPPSPPNKSLHINMLQLWLSPRGHYGGESALAMRRSF